MDFNEWKNRSYPNGWGATSLDEIAELSWNARQICHTKTNKKQTMTQTEREEFEMVAKAVGIENLEFVRGAWRYYNRHTGAIIDWNPRTDDGDAFRVMAKMELTVSRMDTCHISAWIPYKQGCEGTIKILRESDAIAATREAIWKCALECARRGK